MIFTLNNFENQLAAVNKEAGVTPHHYVLNVTKAGAQTVQQIKKQIATSSAGQLLHGIDLRTIFHSEGDSENWSLEACSQTKSLAIVGTATTA